MALVLALVAVSAVIVVGSDDSVESPMSDPGRDATGPVDEPQGEPAPEGPPAKIELRPVLQVLERKVDCRQDGVWCSETGSDGYRLGPVELRTADIIEAEARISNYGDFVVGVTLSKDGAERFEAVTTKLARNTGDTAQLAIVVDDRVVSAPLVQGPITGGAIDISADFTQDQAERLASAIDP